MNTNKLNLKLKSPGDKSISVNMEWTVEGYAFTVRRQLLSSNVNSFTRDKRPIWSVITSSGNVSIPATVKRNEVSIAKWFIGFQESEKINRPVVLSDEELQERIRERQWNAITGLSHVAMKREKLVNDQEAKSFLAEMQEDNTNT